jgi:hypothetical protein
MVTITESEGRTLEAFRNFLSWGEHPSSKEHRVPGPRRVPPAWYAYALGYTAWCPPIGEM